MLRPAAACLGFVDLWEILRKSAVQAEAGQWLVRNCCWKRFRLLHELGGAGSQGITRVEWEVLARLIQSHIWYPPAAAGLVGGWVTNKQRHLLALLSRERCPCSPHPDNSVPPWMSLELFELLFPSLEPRVSVCEWESLFGLFKSQMGLQQPSSLSRSNPHWFSQPDVLGTPLPGTCALGLEAWCVAGTPYS